jgi:Bromodomain
VRSNADERSAFAQSLPQAILSALVIALSDMPANPANPAFVTRSSIKHTLFPALEEIEVEQPRPTNKRARKSAIDLVNSAPDEVFEVKPTVKKPARKSEPNRRVSRRVSAPAPTVDNNLSFTPEKEMEYCRDLIKRMVSGPGYWTRYVPNFKKPVNPEMDNAPNYFDVVKKPMCLNMMKEKMDHGQYASGVEFEADVRLIFQNCYEYWTPADPIWKECEIFEDFFNNQWAQRHKYVGHGSKKVKAEVTD